MISSGRMFLVNSSETFFLIGAFIFQSSFAHNITLNYYYHFYYDCRRRRHLIRACLKSFNAARFFFRFFFFCFVWWKQVLIFTAQAFLYKISLYEPSFVLQEIINGGNASPGVQFLRQDVVVLRFRYKKAAVP